MSLDVLTVEKGITVSPKWSNGIYTIEIVEGGDYRATAIISGEIALRMYALFEGYIRKAIPRKSFNCSAAVHFALGKSASINERQPMPPQGQESYIEDALHRMQLPFVFQICGRPDRRHPDGTMQHTGLVS